MMLAVCTSYILLWAPQLFLLLNHKDAHSHECEGDFIFRSIAMILALCNSSLNFFLYCMTVKKFKEATKLIFFRCIPATMVSKFFIKTTSNIEEHPSPLNSRDIDKLSPVVQRQIAMKSPTVYYNKLTAPAFK